MRFGVFSDLHMEFHNWMYELQEGMTYLNAGDTHTYPFSDLIDRWAKECGATIISIPGNHDYYNTKFPTPGMGQVRNSFVTAATLWTHLSIGDYERFRRGMNDFRMIQGATEEAYKAAHESDLKFIMDHPNPVVMTHHSPSFLSCHPTFAGDPLNPLFHSNLEHVIEELSPVYWIHGHTHKPMRYKIGKTEVICHPRGYPGENPADYKPLYLEI